MKAIPSVYRNPPRPCPPADWMAGGSSDPDAHAAYGFTAAQVVRAAAGAYMEAFMEAPDGVSREELRSTLVGCFVDELERLGA